MLRIHGKVAPNALTRSVAIFSVCVALLFAQPGTHAQTGDALKFFENIFVTGDYVVAGVGLRGKGGLTPSPPGIATGTINISGVPQEADIVAAFLYWQVVSKDNLGPDSGALGATFNGFLLSSADGPFSKVLVSDGTAPCWSSGGATGGSGGAHRTYTYRADVRRFLPVDADERFVANGNHVVQVPDSGPSGNGVPIALGASLAVIFRDPRMPLNAIVLYDGGHTINNNQDTMSQTIKGFYQAAGSTGKITHIVGSGQANKFENLRLPGKDVTNQSSILNPFTSSVGQSWDNPTYELHDVTVTSDGQYGDSVMTSVDRLGFGSFDCLSWGAVIYRTAAKDTDGDGLLDIWETTSGLKDPNGNLLPNLALMGANPNHKDLFVELGYMRTLVPTTYGGALKPAHSHQVVAEALKKAGDAFKNAPVSNPDSVSGIKAHFDVGDVAAYHALGVEYQATGEAAGVDEYLVPSAHARGGESIPESVTNCAWPDCQFPDFPGTVGWKVGFKFFRDQLVSSSPPALDPVTGDDPCDVRSVDPGNQDGPGGVCEKRFDRNRKDMFRYVLGAHFVGLPQSEFPCLDGSNPVPALIDGTCAGTDNPSFHIPRTTSGIGDFPGGDVMLVLGGFPDAAGKPVGTPFMQGATLMHELGHTFDLSHAGIYQVPQVPREANCKPNYLSVMNYSFQLRGLFNNVKPGVPQMDYSGEILGAIDEFLLTDGPLSGTPRYFTGWFAPKSAFTIGSAATKHCDGSPLTPAEAADLAAGSGMVRIDGPGAVGGSVDWNPNPSPPPFPPPSKPKDINFDGFEAALLPQVEGHSLNAGSNDWATLRLNQLGTRRNVLGLSVDVGRDGLGRDGLGRDGLGRDGLGRDGLGRDGLGRDGLGRDGLGRDGLGRDGLGRDGLGRDGLGRDGLGRDVDELDTAVASASGYGPPTNLAASIIGGTGAVCVPPNTYGPSDCHRVQVSFTMPNATPLQYFVKRYPKGNPSVKTDVRTIQQVLNQTVYSIIDATELPNAEFTYEVIAEFVAADGNLATTPRPQSGASITILAVNTPPVAVNDPPAAAPISYTTTQGTPLVVGLCVPPNAQAKGSGVLCNDTDVDSQSLTAILTSGPSSGLVFNSKGSFTYTPTNSFTGTVTFKYKANDVDPSRSSNEATVTITVTKKSGK